MKEMRATVHVRVPIDVGPRVIGLLDGRYAVQFGFGSDMEIHVSAKQWEAIDAAVRAGIKAVGA